jgi:hypothetical protein
MCFQYVDIAESMTSNAYSDMSSDILSAVESAIATFNMTD